MAFEVFNRTEIKYIITEEIYRTLRSEIKDRMLLDGFSSNGEFYTICNIYYDTPDHQMIRRSIDKPIYKEKLRLRSYGTVSSKDRVYLEIKKKFKGYVNKGVVHAIGGCPQILGIRETPGRRMPGRETTFDGTGVTGG
jgi:SPX domain protein involved in polyphosphate accumulation